MNKKTRSNPKAVQPLPEAIPAGAESMDNTLFFVKSKDGEKGPFTLGQLRSVLDRYQISRYVKPVF